MKSGIGNTVLERLTIFKGCTLPGLSFDKRSLALFRISLGLILLGDVTSRFGSLIYYTDAGDFPRRFFWDLGERYFFSLHFASGETWFVALLIVVACYFALCVTVGYRTRFSVFVSWLLLLSIHNRNPFLVSASDTYMRLLLFWSIFIPIAASFSVDHALFNFESSKTNRNRSVASLGLLIQILSVPIFASLRHTLDFHMWHSPLVIGVTFATVFLFLPAIFWETLDRRKDGSPTIYYDGHCSFCRKTAHLVSEVLLVKNVRLEAVDERHPLRPLMEEKDSWIVEVGGHRTFAFTAFQSLIEHSAWRPGNYFFRFRIFSSLGEGLYKFVSARRGFLSYFTARLRVARPFFTVGPSVSMILILLIFGILAWNIKMVYPELPFPHFANVIIKTLRLDQSW